MSTSGVSLMLFVLNYAPQFLYQFISFTVVIDSGSRYEVAYPSGISHFLEKLSFGVRINEDNRVV